MVVPNIVGMGVYFENTMRYEPLGNHKEGKVVLVGHDIQPLIEYLKKVD